MSIVMLLLVIGFILLYRNYNNVINENKIQTVTKAKEVTQEDVKQWKDKIDDHNNEFIETQKDLTEKAKDIRKNTKPSKLPNYGKPIIKDASYNAMLDSLLVAQPN
jgi:peptidoglycan hydrolase CwlO-like protein